MTAYLTLVPDEGLTFGCVSGACATRHNQLGFRRSSATCFSPGTSYSLSSTVERVKSNEQSYTV